MTIGSAINKLRTNANMSQEQFAALFDVSQQSVQKWESDAATPELSKLIGISKYFGVSLDALILGNDSRMSDELKNTKEIKPQYQSMHEWEFYAASTLTEYQQSIDEGLDIAPYKDIFEAVSRLPLGEIKKRFGDVLFSVIRSAGQKEGYPYNEPSDLNSIKVLRRPYNYKPLPKQDLEKKLTGAWFGRVCGCMLGKTVECIRTNELIPFLKETDNYPMHRYIYKSDLNNDILNKYTFHFASSCYADEIDGMPGDDDTNYTVLAQIIIEKYGRDFTPFDVSRAWLDYQPKYSYCTAERVAYCNFVKGYTPPESAIYKNPFREWIGAQIRSDYYGYINPGNPELAAEMAWRDASISHVKNGIYGAMFVAAMLAAAATTDNLEDIIRSGLAQIPHTSRLYEAIEEILDGFHNGISAKDCFNAIHEKYDECSGHGWCHTISNAMIVAAALLYGKGDYGNSICMAVETGFDTDCNGATIGSIVGMAKGMDAIPEYWTKPINDTLHTSIFGVGTVKISDRVQLTRKHIPPA